MPPAFVQSNGGTSNTLNSLGIAFTSSNTVGNLLVCSGVVNVSTLAGLTITDTQGNTWTIALVDNWKALNTFFMAYASNCKAGANTVTIAQLGSLISGAISEYSGVSTTTPLDVTGFSDSGSGTWTSATSGNVTTRANGELIVAAQGNSTGPASVTLGSGFTNLQNDSGKFVSIESQVQATAGAIAGTFTISASSGACGALAFVPVGEAVFNLWTDKGTVFSTGNPEQPNVLFETGSVVLGGGNPVFKMWYGDTNGANYAESADGLTGWTRYSGNPIVNNSPNHLFPRMVKSGSTYYLYTSPFSGSSSIAAYTSTDGVTFTLQNANAIAIGGVSDWDHTALVPAGVFVEGGTWYLYYTSTSLSLSYFPLGVATSTDGINFTKFGSNPILTDGIVSSNFTFAKVGSIYYGWTQITVPGVPPYTGGPGSSSLGLPSDIARYHSNSPFGPWTSTYIPTFYRTLASEGVGLTTGQFADPSILAANGNLYMYGTAKSAGQFGNNGVINCGVITGMTIAQLVATYEGIINVPFPGTGGLALNLVTLDSDNFTRANANPIGGNWSPLVAGQTAQIVSNAVEGSTLATQGDSWWNARVYAANQWAQSIMGTMVGAASAEGANVLSSTSGANTAYKAAWSTAPTGGVVPWFFQKKLAGVNTNLATGSETLNVGDKTTICVVNGLLSAFHGANLLSVISDSAITSGSPGFEIFGSGSLANANITGWSAGNFQDAPALQASISGNAGVGGATVAYSGTSSGSVTADSFGNYLLSNLPDGSYTITPSLSGYTFSPTSASETLNGTNITGVNFTATKVPSKGSGGEQRFGFGFNFKF